MCDRGLNVILLQDISLQSGDRVGDCNYGNGDGAYVFPLLL